MAARGRVNAVDTNVILRMILDDDPIQSPVAAALMDHPTFVGLTVLMEVEWVLRSSYRRPRATIAAVLLAVIDIPTIVTPDDAGIRWAIERYRDHGADFDDMIHIVAGRGMGSFVSFEKRLAILAGEGTPLPIERPA
jgi:predicted nucleic-acid-binding protein